jgi:hypothetical protein
MITREQYDEISARNARFEAWRNGRTSYHPSEIPADVPTVTNDERSAMELYEFVTNPPEKYFLYVALNPNGYTGYGSSHQATTWTGERLGDVQFGRTWRDNFGGTRVSISVYAVNGEYMIEITKKNCAVDAEGNLILLDPVFDWAEVRDARQKAMRRY